MAKDVIGYKVVFRNAAGTLLSARIPQDSVWCVTYPVGIRTEGREGTPVLAFRNKIAAREFAYSDQPVYKASLENPRRIRVVASLLLRHLWGRFWHQEDPTDWVNAFSPPNGTVACDAVTLLEQV